MDLLSNEPQAQAWKPPPSPWTPKCHSRVAEVQKTVEEYFLQNWVFPDEISKAKFLKAGFPRVTCFFFPMAKDDRIEYACRLLTILTLVDDHLESMSMEDGRAYNESLMPIMRGAVQPNRAIPSEFILYDLWQSMREHDEVLANAVLEPTFAFMRAQTDKVRLSVSGFGPYFEYRETDVGQGILSAVLRFLMVLHPSPTELESMNRLECYCARQIAAVNDITSYEKELRASQSSQHEGAVLCSAVKVVMEDTGVGVEAAKRMLWLMAREWERVFGRMAREVLEAGCGQVVRDYVRGLEYLMVGNESWSLTTSRYHELALVDAVQGVKKVD